MSSCVTPPTASSSVKDDYLKGKRLTRSSAQQHILPWDSALSERTLGETFHIVIHTGTSDISTGRIDVAKVFTQVAITATHEYPTAKIILYILLLRMDFCALVQNLPTV